MASQTGAGHPNDPTDSSQDLQLTYDAWNRVVKVTDSETPFVDRLGLYEYDARGLRIIKHTYDSTDTAQKSIHNYYTSSWQCIEEREVDLTITQPAPQVLSKQYVWGLRYVDDLIP